MSWHLLRRLPNVPRGCEPPPLTSSTNRAVPQAFVLHARHATFYLFYAKFPNTYLRDISKYGANYRQTVPDPHTVVIQQSAPFRMRYPRDQAACFRLLANVLCYLVSGNRSVFYMAKDEYNPFYRRMTGLNVRSPNPPPRNALPFHVFAFADRRNLP